MDAKSILKSANDGPSIESATATADLNGLMTDLAELLETSATPESFNAPFLEQVVQVLGGVGGVLWERDAKGQLRASHQQNFDALQLDQTERAAAAHSLLLEDVALRSRTVWSSPHQPSEGDASITKANLSPWALVIAPILVEKKVVGLLEVFRNEEPDRPTKRTLVRLATELAGFAAAHFHKNQWKQLQGQQDLWKQFEAFAARIHKTLDPHEVAYWAANDSKDLLGCDQVSIGLRRGVNFDVGAVSGALTLEKRSPLVAALRRLLTQVGQWGETVVYQGSKDETLPPLVAEALDAYLAQSNCTLLVAAPLIAEDSSKDSQVCGVLLAENFGAAVDNGVLLHRLECVKRHAAPALANALAMDRMPLRWLTGPLARMRDGANQGGVSRWSLCAAVLAVVSALLILVPLPLRKEAGGQLVPAERRVVYAGVNGKILQLTAHPGDRVDKGQELLFIEDLDTQLKADQLSVKIGALNQKLALLDEQLAKPLPARERADLLSDRIKTHYEFRKATVERGLLLAENREPRKTPVRAPFAGQVLTFDAQEKLLGKTVKIGDPLLRLAAVEDAWEVELFLPEREIGLIRSALLASYAGELEVDLLLTSDPHRTYRGVLRLNSLGGETMIRNDKVVLPSRVLIGDRGLMTQLERMPVGVEVRARVNCGRASAGYVWFSEVWDFVYERFLF